MSQESNLYSQKKSSSIVHKPFAKGHVNFFYPPKKNPNGHLASAQLWDSDISEQRQTSKNILELEEIGEAVRESPKISEPEPENQDFPTNRLLNSWKISAILFIIFGNLIGTTAIVWQKYQAKSLASSGAENTAIIQAGQTNLATQEFVELNLNNLKNITISESNQDTKKIPASSNNSSESLPLAIPPTNLPQDIVFPEANKNTQYYYILSTYTGDRSLAIAKAKVPNVSLINFPQGIFIYMGAFTKKDLAEQFVKKLQELGLESYIYPFE